MFAIIQSGILCSRLPSKNLKIKCSRLPSKNLKIKTYKNSDNEHFKCSISKTIIMTGIRKEMW